MGEEPFRADLHIHSVLSPCAEREMLPHCIVLEALEKGLNIIAVTDHNSDENVAVTMELGCRFGVWVIPGIEIESREEVHLLCYFPSLERLRSFTSYLTAYLPLLTLNENLWGQEWVIDDDGKIKERKNHLLTHSLNLSVEDVCERVRKEKGIVIPSHVDRKAYSIVQVLGFVPPQLPVSAVEVSRGLSVKKARETMDLGRYRVVRFSDAHSLSEIGSAYSTFYIKTASWQEFIMAIEGKNGRKVSA